jgi:hypothetical protein
MTRHNQRLMRFDHQSLVLARLQATTKDSFIIAALENSLL